MSNINNNTGKVERGENIIELSEKTQELLETIRNGILSNMSSFNPHTEINGIEIEKIETEKIPEEILTFIGEVKEITLFCLVRMSENIPLHYHNEDGEVYFSGKGGVITNTGDKEMILGSWLGINTTPGNEHYAKILKEKFPTFFAVKYEK